MRKTQFWLLALLIPLMMGIVYSGCKKDEEECTPGDKTALNQTIQEAQQLHDDAVEGTNPGEYLAGSKQALQDATGKNKSHPVRGDFSKSVPGEADPFLPTKIVHREYLASVVIAAGGTGAV